MNKIGVFEEIQYSFKILTNNDFELVESPEAMPISPTTLKNFALNKFWDKLWIEQTCFNECTLWKHQTNSAEHIIHCIIPHKSYNEFVLPLMDSYMGKLGVSAANSRKFLDIFSKISPTLSVALFRAILPFTLIETMVSSLPIHLVLPILNRWSTLSTLWVYLELYLPLQQKTSRHDKRMSIQYILNEPESNHEVNHSADREKFHSTKTAPPLTSPELDYGYPRKPVFCI
ncbi:hypothetical protein K7432_002595 [Basidiobolus ranarum]|uniref:Uncharacterized protein n=1 Tax=Basidiobolus ranarum TaxID=34480 RepID=A0ABR2X1I5_9FUNG